MAAETQEEAAWLFKSRRSWRLNRDRGVFTALISRRRRTRINSRRRDGADRTDARPRALWHARHRGAKLRELAQLHGVEEIAVYTLHDRTRAGVLHAAGEGIGLRAQSPLAAEDRWARISVAQHPSDDGTQRDRQNDQRHPQRQGAEREAARDHGDDDRQTMMRAETGVSAADELPVERHVQFRWAIGFHDSDVASAHCLFKTSAGWVKIDRCIGELPMKVGLFINTQFPEDVMCPRRCPIW